MAFAGVSCEEGGKMGISRLFWPQALLDQWIVDEKISVKGEKLTLKNENIDYAVKQAVLFTADVGEGDDRQHLVGRVKELAALQAMGAEHYMDSVIIEDSAYQVTGGFVGEPIILEDLSKTRPRSLSPASTLEGDDDNEKELLAKFLIENL
jgi:hypothetical protein